jgi:hypothetical protein
MFFGYSVFTLVNGRHYSKLERVSRVLLLKNEVVVVVCKSVICVGYCSFGMITAAFPLSACVTILLLSSFFFSLVAIFHPCLACLLFQEHLVTCTFT